MSEHDPVTDAVGARIRAAADAVSAPPELRARVAAAAAGHPGRGPGRARGRRRSFPRRTLALGLAGVAAVAAALALVVLPASDPTVADATAFTLHAPVRLAPVKPWRRDEHYVDQHVGGIWFPNYGYNTKWSAEGVHVGTVGDRRAVTVTYRDGNHRFAYTIVGGAPLAAPTSARPASAPAGTPVAYFERDGATVVTWRRHGHTCILASRTAALSELLSAVDWKAT